MMISFNENTQIFQLDTKKTSYCFGVYNDGFLMHLYWGEKLPVMGEFEQYILVQTKALSPQDNGLGGWSTNVARMEYPTHGGADLRRPAFQCTFDDGSAVPRLRYAGHKITDGKAVLNGMPCVYSEDGDKVQSLEIELVDKRKDLHVFLNYSVFEDYDVITRSVRVENKGPKCKIDACLSASVDLPEGRDFDFMHLDGCWARERHPQRTPIFCGTQTVDMKNGASGHYHNPFVCFPEHNADEDHGRVYSLGLLWSGEFVGGVQMDSYDTMRVFIGVNDFGFGYTLETGETFQSPEAALIYSNNGIGGMSRLWHKLTRERICRGKFRDIERYALINNWEATYFNFTVEKLSAIADRAKDIGLDLLVLDDGWFGIRNDDHTGLGDWFVNREKLPEGLDGLASEINKRGMKFGLWFEPEMISPKGCQLYEKHPDWALHINGLEGTLGRFQLTLDLSRDDVCDYIIEAVSNILNSANIEYVKWDMNRYMTEVGSDKLPQERQCEVKYRYMLGLYRVLETLTARFPNVLFESCASGGGRFDLGMLYYMPQTWSSDDTDAVERLYIQHGTSICYPYSSMGAHVSVCPNHQVGRVTPLKMRGNVALPGQFGFELDLAKMTEEELTEAKRQVEVYKEFGEVFHRGDLYRIDDPMTSDFASMNFVSEDKKRVVLFRHVIATHPSCRFKYTKLKGLEPEAIYVCRENGKQYSGAMLMNIGIAWNHKRDYESEMFVFEKK
ncbi:MAG: alpha-galactosidase [Clostridia bacterium]|nr:alpha-galactosidase [Clostridia bacterium]